MTQPLNTFVRTNNANFSDPYQAQAAANSQAPLLVFAREYKTGLKTKHAPNGDGEGIVVDLIDLAKLGQNPNDPESAIFCNVLWMGQAVRDQLRNYVGQAPLPIKLVWQQPAGGGNAFVLPEQLDEAWTSYAGQVYTQNPGWVDQVKAARKAKFDAENQNQQAQQQVVPGAAPQQAPTLTPMQSAPPMAQAPVAQQPQSMVQPPAQQAGPPVQPPVQPPAQQAPQVAGPPVQPPAFSPPAAPGAQQVAAPPAQPMQDLSVEQMVHQLNQPV